MKKKNLAILAVFIGVFLPGGNSLLAQGVAGPQLMKQDGVRRNYTPSDDPRLLSDPDMQSLSKDLRSQEKQIVAANMTLTDTEAEKFWPVYDRYAEELARIDDTRTALIMEYAQAHDAMTDEQAKEYVPIFGKVISGKETALFFQIEWRLGLFVDLQLAQTPLIQ